jgi:polysaccharide export outer membrane protein
MIDLEELLVNGDLTLNLPLIHGDIINIPVSGKIFVGGEVRSPGGFLLSGKKLTVSQAVALAGGLKTEAAGSETRIFRYSDKGTGKEIISVNVYSIQKGQAEDLYLKENDIIFVPRSGTKVVLSELWELLKGHVGGVSFGAL